MRELGFNRFGFSDLPDYSLLHLDLMLRLLHIFLCLLAYISRLSHLLINMPLELVAFEQVREFHLPLFAADLGFHQNRTVLVHIKH